MPVEKKSRLDAVIKADFVGMGRLRKQGGSIITTLRGGLRTRTQFGLDEHDDLEHYIDVENCLYIIRLVPHNKSQPKASKQALLIPPPELSICASQVLTVIKGLSENMPVAVPIIRVSQEAQKLYAFKVKTIEKAIWELVNAHQIFKFSRESRYYVKLASSLLSQ